ncbi:MAG: hypothetical protein K2X27_01795 [Candidatus Obscuribacterales bacterium]|nr:hypothetical protein [Candidatus Obscuribacterales bacterium]
MSARTIAPALKALLRGFIDYAGIFPPAKLPLDSALKNFERYAADDYSWMLHLLVISQSDLQAVPPKFDQSLSVIASNDDPRAAAIESTALVESTKPVYCEVSPANLDQLDELKKKACFAKVRTGGIKAELIPSPAALASFISACAARRLAFKATAGLHHPIRAEYALTYEPDSAKAVMHGFLNVLMASAFAFHGERDIEPIISETDAAAFRFDDRACWRNLSLSEAQIVDARKNFIHSVGSCSFEEPVADLKKLGLL